VTYSVGTANGRRWGARLEGRRDPPSLAAGSAVSRCQIDAPITHGAVWVAYTSSKTDSAGVGCPGLEAPRHAESPPLLSWLELHMGETDTVICAFGRNQSARIKRPAGAEPEDGSGFALRDVPMIFALDRGVRQFPIVVEKRLVLAGLGVRVAVPFIEAAGADVVPVDVDLE